MTAGIQPTEMIGAQLSCRIASPTEQMATNIAAHPATAYSHFVDCVTPTINGFRSTLSMSSICLAFN
jgi:hypothetical protein